MNRFSFLVILLIITSMVAACVPETPIVVSTPVVVKETQEVTRVVKEVQTVVPTAQVAKEPTAFKVVTIHSAPVDTGWERSIILSVERVTAAKPHGLTITSEAVERVAFADVERIIREYAASGKYDLIYLNTGYRDAACKVAAEFPDHMFAIKASPNPFTCFTGGNNLYWLNSSAINQCTYLAGAMASSITKSKIVGVTASMASAEINEGVNAFIAGAKATNPDVKIKVTYIDSYFDPVKAREAAEAQLNTGADIIFGVLDGTAEAIIAHKAYGIGNYIDYSYLAPDNMVASILVNWDPGLNMLVDEWWSHKVYGSPYNSPSTPIAYSMRNNSCDLKISDKLVPADVIAKVQGIKQLILDYKLVISANYEKPTSN
jgi:basic membrane protein A